MSHSHMPVNHLLKQIETFRARRGERDVRPAWITAFIETVAELFEPIASDVGRVGFDCRFTDERWIVGMYMGGTEIVGGPRDGHTRHTDFRLDVSALAAAFDHVDQLQFTSIPGDGELESRSSLLVEGLVNRQPLRLQVHAVPPEDAGPAFREANDGTCEPA